MQKNHVAFHDVKKLCCFRKSEQENEVHNGLIVRHVHLKAFFSLHDKTKLNISLSLAVSSAFFLPFSLTVIHSLLRPGNAVRHVFGMIPLFTDPYYMWWWLHILSMSHHCIPKCPLVTFGHTVKWHVSYDITAVLVICYPPLSSLFPAVCSQVKLVVNHSISSSFHWMMYSGYLWVWLRGFDTTGEPDSYLYSKHGCDSRLNVWEECLIGLWARERKACVTELTCMYVCMCQNGHGDMGRWSNSGSVVTQTVCWVSQLLV